MSKRKKNADKVSFWATLPGILTGIAAIITAIGGLTVVLYNIGLFDNKPEPPSIKDNSTSNKNGATSNTSNKPSDCFEEFFSDTSNDRVSILEAGAIDVQIVGPHQSKDDVAGVKFMESNQPVGAMKLRFFTNNNIFKIEEIVDSRCQEIGSSRYRNISRGGDNRVLQNWDELQIEVGDHRYVIRLGYDSGRVQASLQRTSP